MISRLRTRLTALTLLFSSLCSALLPAQTGLIDQPNECVRIQSTDSVIFRWQGVPGRTYFVQVSDPNDHLRKWSWLPVIEEGHGQEISYEMGSTSDKGFFRLHHTMNQRPAGVSLEDWDADGDGLTNAQELSGGTNPVNPDTDGDGLPDGWEVENNLDPLDSTGANGGQGDADGDGSSNGEEYQSNTNPHDEDDYPALIYYATTKITALSGQNHESGNFYSRYRQKEWDQQYFGPEENLGTILTPALGADLLEALPFPASLSAAIGASPETLTKHPLEQTSVQAVSRFYQNTSLSTEGRNVNNEKQRCWIKAAPKPQEQRFKLHKITKRTYSNDQGGIEEEILGSESVTLTIPAGQTDSDHTDLVTTPGMIHGKDVFTRQYLVVAGIIPDWNRDGKIDATDKNKVTNENPWRFWINDDDDAGVVEGSDIPQGAAVSGTNGQNSQVDGIRDLVDFFPLWLDIQRVLSLLPANKYRYRLTHPNQSGDPALRVVLAEHLDPAASDDYLKSIPVAQTLSYVDSRAIHEFGPLLSEEFLYAVFNSQKGLLLIEGVKPTTAPLVLEVESKASNEKVFEMSFDLSVSGVEDMFRWKYVLPLAADLTSGDIPGNPPNWPDGDRNSKHFVFAHGYNVNPDQSKGWAAEMFKRMYWSGSNARMSAFAWKGSDSQIGSISPNYQVNLIHAFRTAKSFKQFMDLLEGEITVAAHSMGNILVGSAMHDWDARPKNYIMLNAAAAKECYDASEAGEVEQEAKMVHRAWENYPKEIRASEWHCLPDPIWPTSDQRRKLTWRNRLRGVIDNGGHTNVYNFYSSGEEVLNNPEVNNPPFNPDDPFSSNSFAWLTPNKTWAMQEKRKGYGLTGYVHTSNYGGWLPNLLPYNSDIHVPDAGNPWGVHRMRTPSELPQPLTGSWLLQRSVTPFFNASSHATLYDSSTGSGSPGSDYAEQHHHLLISEMIPCTTFAAGRNALETLGGHIGDIINPGGNLDMNSSMKTDPNKWPTSDIFPIEENKPRPWLHSDIRNKAFTHNWKAFDQFIKIGKLDQKN